ncbi:unnamed protein product, partial [marine sediment metagenome]
MKEQRVFQVQILKIGVCKFIILKYSIKTYCVYIYNMFLESFPIRSPLSLVDDIKEIIKDKSVCDLGCGAGDLLV